MAAWHEDGGLFLEQRRLDAEQSRALERTRPMTPDQQHNQNAIIMGLLKLAGLILIIAAIVGLMK